MLNPKSRLQANLEVPSQANQLLDRITELSPNSQLRSLYESSTSRKGHVEAELVFDTLVALKDRISKDPNASPRCTNRQLLTRTTLVENLSKVLFAKFPIVEGVALYGSAVRGKDQPGDIDLMILTSPQDLVMIQNSPRLVDSAKSAVGRLEAFIDSNFKRLAGYEVNYFINYTNQDPFISNSLCENGPYLVFVQGKTSRDVYHFANTSGVAYLKYRAP